VTGKKSSKSRSRVIEYIRMLDDLWYSIDYAVSVISTIRWLLTTENRMKEAEEIQKIIEELDSTLSKFSSIIKEIEEGV
jgi:hypothetical protein